MSIMMIPWLIASFILGATVGASLYAWRLSRLQQEALDVLREAKAKELHPGD